MEKEKLSELECMLVVIYKKIDDLERRAKGSHRVAPYSSYHKELKAEADKVKDFIKDDS